MIQTFTRMLMLLLVCDWCVASVASAQQQQTTPPAPSAKPQTLAPAPSMNAPVGPVALPKKANARPAQAAGGAAKNTAEPFDTASVAEMSARCVTLETEAGKLELELLAEAAPETVRNFLNLAATGAFDTTAFSRVVKGFVIQGGNLSTRAEGLTPALALRARRTIADEPNYVKHVRGTVSMARADEPHSATTNFFVLVGDGAHLDGKFAAFGRVTSGMDVADAINAAPAEGEKPAKPVRLTRAVVTTCAPASSPTVESKP